LTTLKVKEETNNTEHLPVEYFIIVTFINLFSDESMTEKVGIFREAHEVVRV